MFFKLFKNSVVRFVVSFLVFLPFLAQARDLLISNPGANNILQYDGDTGNYVGIFAQGGGLNYPRGLAFGPDGNLYVAGFFSNNILKYDGATGAYIGEFVSASSGLRNPYGITFGPDGNLYVAAQSNLGVYVYDASTGALKKTIVSPLLAQLTGLAFDSNGFLYVARYGDDSVAKVDVQAGTVVGTFVSHGSGGLNGPIDLKFSPSGDLFVTSSLDDKILHYSSTGAFLNTYVDGNASYSGLSDFIFAPNNELLVLGIGSASVDVYDQTSGEFQSQLVSSKSGGLNSPGFFVYFPNKAPVANAGPDQSVSESAIVSLDGSNSTDGDNDALTYSWTQVSGPAVSLVDSDTANPSFDAPSVSSAGATLVFALTVSDGTASSNDQVSVQVTNVDVAPVAQAGANQSVAENTLVTLDASASTDADGDTLTFSWKQISGPAVTLTNGNSAIATFQSPQVGRLGATLVFEITVDDGQKTATSQTTVGINNVNKVPSANAGVDQAADENTLVTLNGSASTDADGDALTYVWTQTAGPSVALNTSNPVMPSFTAPAVGPAGVTLSFNLVVNDGLANSVADSVTVTIRNVNIAPIANAGADQTVNEKTSVTLNANASSDADGDALTYSWTQIGGTAVTLDLSNPAKPKFTAPNVEADGDVLTFQVTVSDGKVSSIDSVDVNIKDTNGAPTSDAGTAQTVSQSVTVTLDGSASFDPDGDALSYHWSQVSGTSVTLSNASTSNPTFVSPAVPVGSKITLVFALVVNDGSLNSIATQVTITVENANHTPVADAGPAQTIDESTPVTLDGSASSDADGDALTYQWKQVLGPTVVLNTSNPVHPTFTAPALSSGTTTLVFELKVSDGNILSAASQVKITVLDVSAPPACTLARPLFATIWPPNHRMLWNKILGVRGEYRSLTNINISSITQDEPITGRDVGNIGPDAAVYSNGLFLLRSERNGKGDGRVYQIKFSARSSSGATCQGVVKVCVPHDRRKACVDSGQKYNSLSKK